MKPYSKQIVWAIEHAKQELEAFDAETDKLTALQKYVYHGGDDGILYEVSEDGTKMRRVKSWDDDVNKWEDMK